MLANDTIKELLRIYESAETCANEKNHANLCVCLKSCLRIIANKTHNLEMTLLQYKICAKSYIESNFVDFNIAVTTLLFAIFAAAGFVNNSFAEKILFVVLIFYIVFKSSKQHSECKKLRTIIFVLEDNNIDTCIAQFEKNEIVKEYVVNTTIATKFSDICRENGVAEKDQLKNLMQKFIDTKKK